MTKLNKHVAELLTRYPFLNDAEQPRLKTEELGRVKVRYQVLSGNFLDSTTVMLCAYPKLKRDVFFVDREGNCIGWVEHEMILWTRMSVVDAGDMATLKHMIHDSPASAIAALKKPSAVEAVIVVERTDDRSAKIGVTVYRRKRHGDEDFGTYLICRERAIKDYVAAELRRMQAERSLIVPFQDGFCLVDLIRRFQLNITTATLGCRFVKRFLQSSGRAHGFRLAYVKTLRNMEREASKFRKTYVVTSGETRQVATGSTVAKTLEQMTGRLLYAVHYTESSFFGIGTPVDEQFCSAYDVENPAWTPNTFTIEVAEEEFLHFAGL